MANSPNQSELQEVIRISTSTTLDYNGDWSALFDAAGIAAGPWSGRLLAYINQSLGVTYTEINGAMHAFAVNQGANEWESLDEATAFVSTGLYLEDGSSFLLAETGDFLVQES